MVPTIRKVLENDFYEYYAGGTLSNAKDVMKELEKTHPHDCRLNFDSKNGWTIKVNKVSSNEPETSTTQDRRPYAKKGEKGQKMVTFRLDLSNLDWLQHQPNKGRYINNLIAADRAKEGPQ